MKQTPHRQYHPVANRPLGALRDPRNPHHAGGIHGAKVGCRNRWREVLCTAAPNWPKQLQARVCLTSLAIVKPCGHLPSTMVYPYCGFVDSTVHCPSPCLESSWLCGLLKLRLRGADLSNLISGTCTRCFEQVATLSQCQPVSNKSGTVTPVPLMTVPTLITRALLQTHPIETIGA